MKALFLIVILLGPAAALAGPETNYVAHEWGTFTSVQGGDGTLLPWRPLQNSELPAFVYNWSRPGMGRVCMYWPKPSVRAEFAGAIAANPWLQRLETPVIYFYAHHPMTADVSVRFPQGLITEWYPQASQIGPAGQIGPDGSTLIHSPANAAILTNSGAFWRNIAISPQQTGALPMNLSASHYFAAREAEADLIESRTDTNEFEKFLFYRGAGNFATPLCVTVASNDTVTVRNNGNQGLADLFFISIHGERGEFASLRDLPPSKSVSWINLNETNQGAGKSAPLRQFQQDIGRKVAAALVSHGLYPAEARAMVDTWKDSWFGEEGDRILYLLPAEWTAQVLPMKLTPAPAELIRVMVGRTEILPPKLEARLAADVNAARKGDKGARAAALTELRGLGRFAEPALRLAGFADDPMKNGTLSRDLLAELARSQ